MICSPSAVTLFSNNYKWTAEKKGCIWCLPLRRDVAQVFVHALHPEIWPSLPWIFHIKVAFTHIVHVSRSTWEVYIQPDMQCMSKQFLLWKFWRALGIHPQKTWLICSLNSTTRSKESACCLMVTETTHGPWWDTAAFPSCGKWGHKCVGICCILMQEETSMVLLWLRMDE